MTTFPFQSSPGDVVKKSGKASFNPATSSRRMRFDFLDLTYWGGVGYKDGLDAAGLRILVEHEAETVYEQGIANPLTGIVGTIPNQSIKARYFRRKRLAVYENLFRPVVDKIHAYLTRSPVVRGNPDNPEVASEFARVDYDRNIGLFILDALRFGEGWIGFDAAKVGSEPTTVAEAEAVDPANAGKPYLVLIDPRRIVDWSEQDGEIVRVVIEECEETKADFISAPTFSHRFREWTTTSWTLWESKDSDTKAQKISFGDSVEVVMVETQLHGFDRCPFFRLCPRFPTQDIAELNRAIFNMHSLLDEEIVGNVFTQIVITGAKTDSVRKASRGTGNVLVLEEETAKINTVGAESSQAKIIMERIEMLKRALYECVSMDATGTKNVAESAEKKKRDLEALYTLLLGITIDIERIDNKLAVGMGLIGQDAGTKVQWDKRFDVASLEELRDEITHVFDSPFYPPSYKRSLAKKYIARTDPFTDQSKYAGEIEQQFDLSEARIRSITDLITSRVLDGEMLADALGITDPKRRKELVERFNESQHEAAQMTKENSGAEPADELDVEDDGEVDDAEGSGSSSSDAGGNGDARDRGAPTPPAGGRSGGRGSR